MIEFQVEGLQALEAELLALGPKIGGRALQGALTAAALPIVKEARAKVPLAHDAYRLHGGGMATPGWLRQQIVRKKVRHSKHSAQTLVTFRDQQQAYFWRFIEFGTSKMDMRPFMRPAFESAKQAALDRFVAVCQANIAKARNKLHYTP